MGCGRRPSQWALCSAGCAGKQVAHRYAGWAPALGQAPERRPRGGSVPPAPESPAAAAAAAGSSAGGRQLPDRWAGAGDAALGFRLGELGLASRLALGVLGMDRPHLAAKQRDEVLCGRSPANPGPCKELAFGLGPASWLAAFQPALAFAEPSLERPTPARPLQRQTTWAGRSLRDPASPMGRLVKSGSLGSARGARPTVEAAVAHSECPRPTHTLDSLPNQLPVSQGQARARTEGWPSVVGTAD